MQFRLICCSFSERITYKCVSVNIHYPEGYISVQDILQHRSCRGKYNLSDVQRVVTTNDKQRFKLRNNPSTNIVEIKANQGHTIAHVDDSELTPIIEPKYKTVVHGTYNKYWARIKVHGLSCMQRRHIHFAKGTLDNPSVISGLRRDVQIYIFIDLQKALLDGLKFYESENGVILTAGNEEGYLEPKYFSKAISVDTGFPAYTQPQDLVRIFANYGAVKVDKMTGKFAVLAFEDEDEAAEAVEDSTKVNIYGEFLTVRPYAGKLKQSTPKRELTRSKQKGEIIEPQLLELKGDFHQQLDNVLNAVRLTQEEVTALSALYVDLNWVLQQQWPGCVAMPFGSITTGLGIKSSDADCFINVPQVYRTPNANFVNKAKKLLQQHPRIFAEILSIPRANTPIVKFFHVPTETNCDVTFKTPLGAQNSKLIAFLLHADPRLVPMAVVVKYWAKVHGFSGTGRLTNYTLTMLIIFYLQQPHVAILPSVEWLQRDAAAAVVIDHWNTGFMHDHELLPRTSNAASISELLGDFFQYYSMFNFEELVVCPFLGVPIAKEAFKDASLLPAEFERYKRNVEKHSIPPLKFTTCVCVQDPIELSHNVASAVSSRLAMELKAFFKFAAAAYEKEKVKNCVGFLKTILLQRPKLPRNKGCPEFRVVMYPHILQCIGSTDWTAVVRQVMVQLFEGICKILLSKVEEKSNESKDAKRHKERYIGTLTKAIWKRKQFSKLYSLSHLNFLNKQTRITEEILRVDKENFKLKFQLTLIFSNETRNATAAIKITDGDPVLFREFGKFFMSSMQSWYMALLRPYTREKAEPKSPNANDNSNTADKDISDDLKVEVVTEDPGSSSDFITEDTDDADDRNDTNNTDKINDSNKTNNTNDTNNTDNKNDTNKKNNTSDKTSST